MKTATLADLDFEQAYKDLKKFSRGFIKDICDLPAVPWREPSFASGLNVPDSYAKYVKLHGKAAGERQQDKDYKARQKVLGKWYDIVGTYFKENFEWPGAEAQRDGAYSEMTNTVLGVIFTLLENDQCITRYSAARYNTTHVCDSLAEILFVVADCADYGYQPIGQLVERGL